MALSFLITQKACWHSSHDFVMLCTHTQTHTYNWEKTMHIFLTAHLYKKTKTSPHTHTHTKGVSCCLPCCRCCKTFHGAWQNHVLVRVCNHMVRSSTKENPAEFSSTKHREKERKRNKGLRAKEWDSNLFSCDKLVGIMESVIERGEIQGRKEREKQKSAAGNIAAVVQ